MGLQFTRASASWTAQIDGKSIYLDGSAGGPDPAQASIAERLSGELAGVAAQATAYLDTFVDRRRACGDPHGDWWLEEVEMRGLETSPSRCRLGFTLAGDDGGYWTVEFLVKPDEFRPVRMERVQG